MKWIKFTIIMLALLAVLALPATALARGPLGDEIVLGGTFTLNEGETLSGNLVVLGGSATLEPDSQVTGDIFVAGGSLTVSGEVDGDVLVAGGRVRLNDSAVVRGDVGVVGGNLDRDPGAVIEGDVTDDVPVPFQFVVPGGLHLDGPTPEFQVRVNPIWQALMGFVWTVFRAFLWAGAAVLVVMFLPLQTRRVADTVTGQPLVSGGLGLATVLVAPLVLAALAITILLIPVSLLGFLALAVIWAFGLIAIGTEVGRRLTEAARQDWPLAVSAAAGTFLLTLLLNFFRYVVCVGWIPAFLVGFLGVGAVLLTRFGTQVYPPQTGYGSPAVPQVPPPAPYETTTFYEDEE